MGRMPKCRGFFAIMHQSMLREGKLKKKPSKSLTSVQLVLLQDFMYDGSYRLHLDYEMSECLLTEPAEPTTTEVLCNYILPCLDEKLS